MKSHLLGQGRDASHPDRRDVAVRHQGDDNYDGWPVGTLELIEALRNFSNRSDRSPQWRTDTHVLVAGTNRNIAHRRLQRARAIIWPDPANTGPVFVSSTQISNDPTGADRTNAIKLTGQLELSNPGQIYAFAPSAGQIVYVMEEFLET